MNRHIDSHQGCHLIITIIVIRDCHHLVQHHRQMLIELEVFIISIRNNFYFRHPQIDFIFWLLIPGSVSYSAHNYGFRNPTNSNCDNNAGIACLPQRAVHERSHSDGTTTPMPVDLSMESSSVTSLSNLPLRKHTITSGKFQNKSSTSYTLICIYIYYKI